MRRGPAALLLLGLLLVITGLTGGPPAGAAAPSNQLAGAGESWPEYTVRQLQNSAVGAGALGSLEPVYIAGRGEAAALDDLAAGATDFAVAQAPMTADQRAVAHQNGVEPAYVPYAFGAVGIAAAVQTDPQHGRKYIEGIKLSIPTLAKIFTHNINYWNDPEILAENADVPDLAFVEVPQILTAVRRDSSSTSTALVAAFLADPTSASVWRTYAQGLGQDPNSTPDTWPADPRDSVTGVTSGSKGVIDALLNISPVTGQPIPNLPAHSIGYVAPEFARQYQAPLVAVRNLATPSGYVLPVAGAVTGALASGAVFDPATNLYTIDYSKITAAGAYPLPLVSYLVVPAAGAAPAKAAALAQFIRFVLGNGQTDVVTTGMVGATAEAITAGRKVADALAASATATTTTTATTATTTPTDATTTSTTSLGATAAGPTTTSSPTTTTSPIDGAPSPQTASSPMATSGASVSSSDGSARLPFTGAPNWALAAGGLGLVGAGHAVSRRLRRPAP